VCSLIARLPRLLVKWTRCRTRLRSRFLRRATPFRRSSLVRARAPVEVASRWRRGGASTTFTRGADTFFRLPCCLNTLSWGEVVEQVRSCRCSDTVRQGDLLVRGFVCPTPLPSWDFEPAIESDAGTRPGARSRPASRHRHRPGYGARSSKTGARWPHQRVSGSCLDAARSRRPDP
jgi:hypothetical protein